MSESEHIPASFIFSTLKEALDYEFDEFFMWCLVYVKETKKYYRIGNEKDGFSKLVELQ